MQRGALLAQALAPGPLPLAPAAWADGGWPRDGPCDALSPEAQRRLMLGGHPVDATDARTMGIVDEIAKPEALMDRALTVARDYAKNPPLAYAAIKAQLRQPALAIIHDAIDNGSDPTRAGWFTAETKAAMAAIISDLR